MKTSLDLPDDLYRRVKARSAMEGRAVREVATELLTAWVESAPATDASIPSAAASRRDWLYEWSKLGARVDRAAAKPKRDEGLVEQLRRDRR